MPPASNTPEIPENAPGAPPLRVGVVPYLNMLPLVHGMESLRLDSPSAARIAVFSVPPSRMTEMMDRGELDIGMVPTGAFLDRPDWKLAGSTMIGSRGPVKSVLAMGLEPPEKWTLLHPDSHSRTSNLMVQVILAGIYGVRPRLGTPVPLDHWQLPQQPESGEAFLLIGTRALRWREGWRGAASDRSHPQGTTLDLGEIWTEWTGLPFVYAVWAARAGLNLKAARIAEWMEKLDALKRQNLARLKEIIPQWPDLEEERLTPAEAEEYLTSNIVFDLGEAEREGLERFKTEAAKLGLIASGK